MLGRGDDFSFQPYCDGGEFHEAHEVGEQLVVSCGDTPELLQLAEEALDGVALPVEMFVIGALDLAIALGWDDHLRPGIDDGLDEMVGVVTLVGDDGISVEPFDQVMGQGDVIALTRCTDEANGKSQSITGGMDFGAQASARPAQALGIRPPFSLRAPAACW